MHLTVCIVPLLTELSKSFLCWSRLKYLGTVNKELELNFLYYF